MEQLTIRQLQLLSYLVEARIIHCRLKLSRDDLDRYSREHFIDMVRELEELLELLPEQL